MTIRVLHIIGSLGLGGAQVCLKQIVENNPDADIEHYVYPLRSRTIDIPIESNLIRLGYRNYDPRKFFAILSLCRQHNIDIIHAHLHKPIMGALLTKYFTKRLVIVHEHCSVAYSGLQYSIYRTMLKILKKKADLYIAVSKATKNDLNRLANINPEAIRVIYNAVDLEKFTPKATVRDFIRKQLSIKSNDIVIGFVGRLSPVKGPELTIKALALLLKENQKYLAVFLGCGKQQKRLAQYAEELGVSHRVKFLGFRENVSEILNIFDLAVMPSRKEGLPLTALEYMSMKIPLISSGVDGLAEILTDRQNALILKENTPLRIHESILEISNNPVMRQSLIDNAYQYIQQFSIPLFVNQINMIYRELKNKNYGD